MTTTIIHRINLKELEATLSRSTPVLAVVGAGDLAFEKLLAAREELSGRAAGFDPKTLRDQAQGTIAGGVGALQSELQGAPEQLRTLPEKAQEWPTKAQSLFADLVSAAFATYGELVGRGTHRVSQVRQHTPDAVDVEAGVTPVSRPKTSTARKSGSTAKKSTAKRSATKSSTGKPSSTKSTAKKSSTNESTAKPSTASSSPATSSSATSSTATPSTAKPSTGSATDTTATGTGSSSS